MVRGGPIKKKSKMPPARRLSVSIALMMLHKDLYLEASHKDIPIIPICGKAHHHPVQIENPKMYKLSRHVPKPTSKTPNYRNLNLVHVTCLQLGMGDWAADELIT